MTKQSYEIKILSYYDSLEEWDHFVDDSPQGCIFYRSWWLKAVCRDNFQILIIRREGKIMAGIPLPIFHKLGQTSISMPKLTQILGVILLPSSKNTYERRLSDEIAILKTIISAMPRFSTFSVNFHYNFTNWLPFYWAGYKQTTWYTYVIKDLTDLNKVFSNFAPSKKRNIKKAERLVTVSNDLSAEDFYANHTMTLRKEGKTTDYEYDLFKRIYDATLKHSAGKIWCAIDKQKNIHSAIFVVFDGKSAYYLVYTIDPDYKDSGATSLLIKEAIAYVSRHTKRFDFEGSMIRGVEHSYRKFGAIQTPYFNITKDNRSLPVKVSLGLLVRARSMLRKLGWR